MGKKIPMIGNRFGRLVVIEEAPKHPSGHARWLCKCDCGSITDPILGTDLRTGKVLSCKCLHKELLSERVKTHGKTRTRLYRIWQNMRNRCNLPSVPCHRCYGERGITVCEEWNASYQVFEIWALSNGYSEKLTLDRIDNDKGYSPENCRWVSRLAQANNLRKNIIVDIGGESHTLAEWSHISGIKYSTLYARYMRGWDSEKLLE